MLCFVLHGIGDLRAEECPVPAPGPGEALVKIAGCAICHTDLAVIDGDFPIRGLPLVLGHEYAGTIAEVGPGTTAFAVGERVTAHSGATCGLCEMCRHGMPWLCLNKRVYNGGYAEYVALPERCLYRVPPEVTDEQAICTNPFAIAVHAVDASRVQPGASVAVVGGGAIGLLLVALLRFAGAGPVIVSEPSAERRSMALEFGAHVALDPFACDLAGEIRALTNGLGVHVVLESAGTIGTIEQSFGLVRRGGAITIVGVPAPQSKASFSPFDVVTGNLTIHGSIGPGWNYPRTIELLPKVRPERVFTHRLPLSQLPEALGLRRRNIGIKVLVVP
ncbi:MAG: alcohol dehydrogenase catalytic domain-containing protein [Chloroflexi bacterium]|nr:alcohol dehydrogenase catalytic domain-containing protein [Chloroflexota bacterium]MCL5109452.1 alcohol dehydrogenase catalytic domain-containing protein [Chloroflexota bacterium]MDA8217199.1 alcohol dehydrogenase catalytic domain-containing protein [Dehalococcoidales bacterium]